MDVQSSSTLFKVQFPGDTEPRVAVCQQSSTFNGTTAITEEESNCGVHVGVGANKWEYTLELIVKADPSATEASYDDFFNAWHAKQLVTIVDRYPATGTKVWYQSGDHYITNITRNAATSSVVKCSITFKGVGELDIAE